MIGRFLDAGHSLSWVAGDEVYGGNPKLRSALQERGVGYVLAVGCSAEVTTAAGRFRADPLAAEVPKRAWQKLSAGAGAGAKGHRFYDWAVIGLAPLRGFRDDARQQRLEITCVTPLLKAAVYVRPRTEFLRHLPQV